MGKRMPKIALVDDDRHILTSVSMALEAEGYQTQTYTDGVAALQGLEDNPPDMAIFDIKIPRMDGMELLRRLRQRSDLPVVFLTSKDDEIDELFGLKMGADDFIRKPFSQRLLVERVKAVLRRGPVDFLEESSGVYRNAEAGLEINFESMAVSRHGRPVNLARTEYKLLELLVRNEGRVLSGKKILLDVWGREFAEETTYLKVYIRRVRNKLWDDPQEPELIHSLRGVGYSFRFQPRGK